MIFKNSKFLLVVFSLTASVSLAVLVFAAYDIRRTNEETSGILNTSDQIAEERILLQSIRVIQNESREELMFLEGFVVSDDTLVPLLDSIESIGQELGLESEILSVEDASLAPTSRARSRENQEAKLLRIVVEAKGSWSGVFNFTKALENLPYKVTVEEVNLSKDEGWSSRMVILVNTFK